MPVHFVPDVVRLANGFEHYNPMQQLVLESAWQQSNLIVASPTASGKTIIAELCGMESILNKRKKVIYTAPLRALASEHYNDFKKKYAAPYNIRMAVSTGDMDSSSKYLSQYDFIFTTFEKLNSLLIHRADWLTNVGTLIIDELHEMDSDRGSTLEMVITKMRLVNTKIQIVVLSATIPNADELSAWLKAELIQSDYRPVPLKEGVHYNGGITFKDDSEIELSSTNPLEGILVDTLQKKKQSLLFANTRPRAESLAKEAQLYVVSLLSNEEKKDLEKLSRKVEGALEIPTAQCTKLAQLVKNGVAFHHAGLVHAQREAIENGFREGKLKVIAATPTLAAGVNLPSFRVVITSLYRYDFGGMVPIPVREYRQMSGRAGRPRYDNAGESIILAKNEMDAAAAMENYIKGEMENVNSTLGKEPTLRMHLLALIAGEFIRDATSLREFFSQTFYAFQYKNMDSLMRMLVGLAKELEMLNFIRADDDDLSATPLGKRVAELYLDPLSADSLIQTLKRENLSTFGALYGLVNTTEFRPYVNVGKKNEAELWEQFQVRSPEISVDAEEAMFSDTQILEKFLSAKFLESWISEVTEQQLVDEFNIQPGIIRSKLKIVDWLAYSAVELAPFASKTPPTATLNKLRKRLQSGISEELILLCELRGIGRVRARRLFNANIKNVSDVKNTSVENLAKILGSGVAISVKRQLGTEVEKGLKKKLDKELKQQKTLFD